MIEINNPSGNPPEPTFSVLSSIPITDFWQGVYLIQADSQANDLIDHGHLLVQCLLIGC